MSATLNQCEEFCGIEEIKTVCNAEIFQRYTWLTPNQLRDSFFFMGMDTPFIKYLKGLALAEQTRRKTLPNWFVECPRCRGWHGELNNSDNLCESCEWTVHIIMWDREHGIKPT